jgi:hypothetical protein
MDYYDRHCWRCGEPAHPDLKGRVLCASCRFWIAVGPLPGSGNRHPMEWYLTHCWHCEETEVPMNDDLGLCRSCVGMIGEPQAV